MHMADALVSPAVAGTMYACSAAAAGYSIRYIRKENDEKKIPVMGVMGAFVFATQMINFTIPGTGSSGHLCGGMLLSSVLGPEAGFLTMIGVLLVQALLFADGGLLALGANIWNMAFYGCFIGGMLIWKFVMKHGMTKRKIVAASVAGSVLSLQLGAFSVTLETLASGISELPFTVFVAAMQPVHLAIGLVEGLIMAAVLVFLYEVRPELLWMADSDEGKEGHLSWRGTLAVLAAASVVIGGLLSLVASSHPDGLEWSMQRVAGTTELQAEGGVYSLAEKIQQFTSVLPDYEWKSSETPTTGGTMFSGVVGAVIVIVLCVAVCYLFRFFRHRKKETEHE